MARDKVLLLLLDHNSKLLAQWCGLCKITQKMRSVDYEILCPGQQQEKHVFHINLLKEWKNSPEGYMLDL